MGPAVLPDELEFVGEFCGAAVDVEVASGELATCGLIGGVAVAAGRGVVATRSLRAGGAG